MLLISLCVSSLCLFIERKNLTLKTCAPDFSARSMTKLYAKIKGARAISLFDFPKTWQVCQYGVASLCNQLLPEFSSNQFETFHRCYKHIEDVHVTFSRQENNF